MHVSVFVYILSKSERVLIIALKGMLMFLSYICCYVVVVVQLCGWLYIIRGSLMTDKSLRKS